MIIFIQQVLINMVVLYFNIDESINNYEKVHRPNKEV